VHLVSEAVPQVKNYRNFFDALRLRQRPCYFFTSPIERKGIARNSSPRDNNFARLSKYVVPQKYPAKRRVQASDPEGSALVTFRVAMSSNPRTISRIERR